MKTITTQVIVQKLAFLVIFSLLFVNNSFSRTGNPEPGVAYALLAATANKSIVLINWKTIAENNNNYFEVERSSDMINFKTVALILDGFTSEGTGKSYSFKEAAGEVSKGNVVYYRLKQINKDGIVNYSPILKVELNKQISIN